jgi:aldehyde:ferredoxin oxidoreductase
MTALNGAPYGETDLDKLGRLVLKTEHDFNARAGFTKAHDRLPDFMSEIKIKPHDLVFDVPYDEVDTLRDNI